MSQITPFLKLIVPDIGSPGWGAPSQANLFALDEAIGALQNVYVGPWDGSLSYSKGQIVSYTSGGVSAAYISLGNANYNHVPVNSPADWVSISTAPGINFTGPWQPNHDYAHYDVVTYLGGSYVAPGALRSGNSFDPSQFSVLTLGLGARGTWSGSALYAINDVVSFNSSSYISLVDANQGHTPNAGGSTFWSLLAAAGTPGQPGGAGPAGPAGSVTAEGVNGDFIVPGVNKLGPVDSSGSPVTTKFTSGPLIRSSPRQTTNWTVDGAGKYVGATVPNPNGADQWAGVKGHEVNINSSTRSISQGMSIFLGKHAIGDSCGLYVYNRSEGGPLASDDEGNSGISTHMEEPSDYFKGTIASTTGTGDVAPGVNQTGGVGYTVDGTWLLNISKGTLAGSLNNPFTVSLYAGSRLGSYNVTGTALPLTTAWGYTSDNIPQLNNTADTAVVVTLNMQLGQIGGAQPPFVVGPVSVAGVNLIEQSYITAVGAVGGGGSQTVTLALRYPNLGAALFQGGVAGQYVSMDAIAAFSGGTARTVFPAFGSLTGADLIYGVTISGAVRSDVPRGDAEVCATYGSNAGFHLYPGAEIIRNNTTNANPQLEPNTVQWAVGDVVENPKYPYLGCRTLFSLTNKTSATNFNAPAQGLEITSQGYGISGSFNQSLFANYNSAAWYQAAGGPMPAPVLQRVRGTFGVGTYYENVPSTLFFLDQPLNAGDDLALFYVNFDGQGMTYKRGTKAFHFSNVELPLVQGSIVVKNGGLICDYGVEAISLNASYGGISSNGLVNVMQGLKLSRRDIGDYDPTIQQNICLVAFSSINQSRTVTLPTPSDANGLHFTVKDETGLCAAGLTITVQAPQNSDGSGTGTIDGAATKVLNSAYASIRVYSNGLAYFTC